MESAGDQAEIGDHDAVVLEDDCAFRAGDFDAAEVSRMRPMCMVIMKSCQ